MKKILTGFSLITILVLQSCLKSDENVDFSDLQMITQILWPPVASSSGADATGSGLSYFGAGALNLDPSADADTTFFIVSLAGTNSTMAKDLPITIGVDATKLQDNFSSDSITYELMPDSIYTILSTSGSIQAGKRLDTFYVVFYPNKIDPSKNYGLPITITSAPGTTVSSNFGTLYLHTIGNPLAGTYIHNFRRYNAVADTTGAPNSTNSTMIETIAPVNPTTLLFPQPYLEVFAAPSTGYTLTFDNALTTFTGTFTHPEGIAGGGLTLVTGPILVNPTIVGDASTNYAGSTFEFYTDVLNTAGASRKLIDVFVKQ